MHTANDCRWSRSVAPRSGTTTSTHPGPETEGFIEAVETCGAVDGPGLRYVVFTKGCPLRCQYCHNPETQGRPTGETTTAGKILSELSQYKTFLRRGGLTISGGEPLVQPDFVHAIAHGAKQAGIHTALDTSGFLGWRASESLLSNIDLVLLDIKSGLPETYRKVTGVDLSPTLQFAKRLEARGTPMWIRFVLVPGLTDAPENIRAIAEFVRPLSQVSRIEILPFHKIGEFKYERSGLPYQLKDTPSPTLEQIETARALFAEQGLKAL